MAPFACQIIPRAGRDDPARRSCGDVSPCFLRAVGAKGRTGLGWGGRHHSESDEYCTGRRGRRPRGSRCDGVSPSGLGDGARGKVGRIVPMRSGVGLWGGRGMRWEFREDAKLSTQDACAPWRTRPCWGGRHHSESDGYCTGRGRTGLLGGCIFPPAPEGRRKVAGGGARNEREPPVSE